MSDQFEGAPTRSLFQRVKDGVRSFWQGPYLSSGHDPWWLFGRGPVASGVVVSEETALGVSAFFCAVSTISQDIASLPLFLYKGAADGGKARFETHPLNRLLHDQPNPETTSFQLRAALMVNALATGNGYAEIQRDGAGRPAALWHLQPHRVSLFRQDGELRYRVSNAGGGDSILEPSDVLHIKGPSPDGLLGYDIVRLGREALGLSIAAERFGAGFFGNGSQLGGALTMPGSLTELSRKNLREALASRHQGVDNAHKWMLLENGATFTPIGVNPRDSQFNELRVHQVREVARFFKIPVAYLGDLERATYSNFEQMQLTYFTTGLRPWLVSIEQELDSKLIASSERNIQHFEHLAEGFLRADTEKRAQFYTSMITNGIMTINECRSRENLPPIAGGDVPRVPMNTEPLSTAPVAPARMLAKDSVLLAAARDVLIEAFERAIIREADRARKAQVTRDKFSAWLGSFYDVGMDGMRRMLVPAVRNWLVCTGGDLAAVDPTVDALVDTHIAESRRDLQRVLEDATAETLSSVLERVLRRWELERAPSTVDRLMQKGCETPALEATCATADPPVPLPAAKMFVTQWRVENEVAHSKVWPYKDKEYPPKDFSPALAQLARGLQQSMTT